MTDLISALVGQDGDEVSKLISHARGRLEEETSGYLVPSTEHGLDATIRFDDVKYILDELDSEEALHRHPPLSGVGSVVPHWSWCSTALNRFIKLFLTEIREAICDEKKLKNIGSAAGVSGTALVAALAAQISETLGTSSPGAIALATALLLTVAYASKGAFCRMTDAEFLKALDERVKDETQK